MISCSSFSFNLQILPFSPSPLLSFSPSPPPPSPPFPLFPVDVSPVPSPVLQQVAKLGGLPTLVKAARERLEGLAAEEVADQGGKGKGGAGKTAERKKWRDFLASLEGQLEMEGYVQTEYLYNIQWSEIFYTEK